jgi:signal transduction histidine kinase/DNA-binding LacI/PurR family transcriptional regulator/CheY-like chemotaxis protein
LNDPIRIGLLVDSLLSRYQLQLFRGVRRVARPRGVRVVGFQGSVLRGEGAARTSFDGSFVYELAAAPAIDGLVVASNILANAVGTEAVQAFCSRSGLPVVSVGDLSPFPHVTVDGASGLSTIIEHLVVAHGRRRLAFIRGGRHNPDSADRERIFRETLLRLNVPVAERLILPGDFLEPSGAVAIRVLFDERGVSPGEVDAIVGANDLMAVGAIHALAQRHVRVPEDIAVVGFDDDDHARSASPPLTTVAQPVDKAGARAAELLLDLLDGQRVPERTTIACWPVYRTSCGCRAGELRTAVGLEPRASLPVALAEAEAVALDRLEKLLGTTPETTGIEALTRALLEPGERRRHAALQALEAAVLRTAATGTDLLQWEHVLSPFVAAIERYTEARPDDADGYRERMLRAQLVVSEAAARTQGLSRLHVLQQANSIRVLGSALVSARSFRVVRSILQAGLPGLGVRYGCVCLFVPGTDRRLATVASYHLSSAHVATEVLQNDAEMWRSLPATAPPTQPPPGTLGDAAFAASGLVPSYAAPPASLPDLLVYPLVFGDDPLGYVIFDVPDDIEHAWLLENVARHLSTAVHSMRKAEALRDAREAAEKASAAKTEFVAVMSHEVRTPLTAVIGHMDLCLQTTLDRDQTGHLKRARVAASALLGIVTDILDFSKIEASKLDLEAVRFELGDVLDQTIGTCALSAVRKGLELVIDVAHDVPRKLVGDPLRLGQVIVNLVSNAIKFSPNGHVLLAIGCVGERVGEGVRAGERVTTLRVSVRDTGIGIARDDLDAIFRPFTQADSSMTRRYGGTGLGLAISKRLVEMMGGELRAESAPGRGSTFTFEACFGIDEGAQASADARDGAGVRVLVALDHALQAEAMRKLLEAHAYDVQVVDSVEAAVVAVRCAADAAPIDIAIVDLGLPGAGAADALHRIAQPSAAAPLSLVVVGPLSGDGPTVEKFRRHGVSAAIGKPFHAAPVLAALRRARRFAASSAPPPPEVEEPLDDVRLDGRRVLVVQDSEASGELVCELIEGAGADVELARDGLQAVEFAKRRTYDAILMDLHMPELDGFEATRAIRSDPRHARVPILALTASAVGEDKKRCLAAGMNDFIATPVHARRLLKAVLDGMHEHERPSGGRLLAAPRSSDTWRVVAADPGASAPPADATFRPGGELDTDAALTRLGSRRDTYRRLLQRFTRTHATATAELRDALAAADVRGATLLVHTVGSAAANIGATRLQRAAVALEAALRVAAAAPPPLAVRDFELAHQAALTDVTRALGASHTDWPAASAVSPALVGLAMERLDGCLAQHDTTAVACLQSLREALGDDWAAFEPIHQLEISVHDYDFEQARRELEKLEDVLRTRAAKAPATGVPIR